MPWLKSASLGWLALLVGASVATALASGAVLYRQTRVAAETRAQGITGGMAARGLSAIDRHGCGACHIIPGIDGARGEAGPDLTGIATRAHIAGSLPNDPQAMVRWLMDPQALRPGSGMPDMGIDEAEARDIAAYLYAS